MARKYAVSSIPGIKGTPATHVAGAIIEPGDPLPAGTKEFILTYWYMPTPADIAAGATPGERIVIATDPISVNDSLADIRREILSKRVQNRVNKSFGSTP